MNTNIPKALNLPPVNQIGFVVRDLELALKQYEPLFGEFTVMDAADLEWDYRGTPETTSSTVAFRIVRVARTSAMAESESRIETTGGQMTPPFFQHVLYLLKIHVFSSLHVR